MDPNNAVEASAVWISQLRDENPSTSFDDLLARCRLVEDTHTVFLLCVPLRSSSHPIRPIHMRDQRVWMKKREKLMSPTLLARRQIDVEISKSN